MESRDEPILGPPAELLNVEGLNYLVAALLVVGDRRLGARFSRDVLDLAKRFQAERQVVVAFNED